MLRSILLLVFSTLYIFLFSQTINTDRPGISNSPLTLSKGQFNLETGVFFEYTSYNRTIYPNYYNYGYPSEDVNEEKITGNFAFRLGLTDFIELRFLPSKYKINRFVKNLYQNDSYFEKISGMAGMVTGFKVGIFNQSDKNFHLSVMPEISLLPNSRTYFMFSVNAGYLILDKFYVNTTVKAKDISFDLNVNPTLEIYKYTTTLCFNYKFSDKLTFFAEPYLNYQPFFDAYSSWFSDFGALYLINPTWQVDLSFGYGENYSFINIGMSCFWL